MGREDSHPGLPSSNSNTVGLQISPSPESSKVFCGCHLNPLRTRQSCCPGDETKKNATSREGLRLTRSFWEFRCMARSPKWIDPWERGL